MATEQAAPDNIQVVRNGGPTTLDLYRAALGPVRTDYYLKAFTRFDAAGHSGPSWNTLAALITLNWLAFRKLWGAALAYVGIAVFAALLLLGIGALVFKWPAETQWTLAGIGLLLAVLVPGLWGNAWLYAACTKRIEAAITATITFEDACERLAKTAPSRRRMGALTALNALLLAGVAAAGYSWHGSSPWPTTANKPSEAHGAVSGPVQSGLVTSGPVAAGLVTPAASTPAASAPAVSASATASAPLAALAPAPVASAPALTASVPQDAKKGQADAPAEKATLAASAPKPATPAKREPKKAAQPAKDGKPSNDAKTAKAVGVSKSPAARASAPAKALPKEEKYLINVGLFADENNARNATTRLQDAGLPAIAQSLKSSKGPRTRVRVGPFDTEAEAERAAETIRSLQLEAQVFKP